MIPLNEKQKMTIFFAAAMAVQAILFVSEGIQTFKVQKNNYISENRRRTLQQI